MSWQFWAIVLAWNVVGYAVAVRDKALAGTGRRRVRERTLLVLAFLGAGLGLAVAFKVHRHKTRKPRFLVRFWPAAVVGALLVAVLWRLFG